MLVSRVVDHNVSDSTLKEVKAPAPDPVSNFSFLRLFLENFF